MNFLTKTIVRKLFLSLVALGALMLGVVYLFFYPDKQSIPFFYLPVALAVFLMLTLLIYWVEFARPIKIVLAQMQALLSASSYKKIYSTRIDEVGILAHFFNEVTKGLVSASSNIAEGKRMLNELTIASELQQEILPKQGISVPGLQLVAKSRPATEVGGDIFDLFTVNNKTYIYVGDVTGHGAAAGLIMTMVNSLITVFAHTCSNAHEILVNVNRYLRMKIKKPMFMTLVMLCWDQEKKELSYVGAGHEHILIYRADTGVCERIISGGVALGMVPDNEKVIMQKPLNLNDGDFVVLYSDGITEARNEDEELFGLDRLCSSIAEYAVQYSAEGVNYHVAKDVSKFMGDHVQDDDMTLIVIKKDNKITGAETDVDRSTIWKD